MSNPNRKKRRNGLDPMSPNTEDSTGPYSPVFISLPSPALPPLPSESDKDKDKDKDKDIDYDISNLVKTSVTKDGDLIELQMQGKNKTVIQNCLSSIIDDIRVIQNTKAKPLIQSKNNELMLLQEKIRDAEEFKNKLKKNLNKINGSGFFRLKQNYSLLVIVQNQALFS